MGAKVEGGEAFSRALSAELWAPSSFLLLSEPKTWSGRPDASWVWERSRGPVI
jgi:hypothetical protein